MVYLWCFRQPIASSIKRGYSGKQHTAGGRTAPRQPTCPERSRSSESIYPPCPANSPCSDPTAAERAYGSRVEEVLTALLLAPSSSKSMPLFWGRVGVLSRPGGRPRVVWRGPALSMAGWWPWSWWIEVRGELWRLWRLGVCGSQMARSLLACERRRATASIPFALEINTVSMGIRSWVDSS
jgi:hypothetical protein